MGCAALYGGFKGLTVGTVWYRTGITDGGKAMYEMEELVPIVAELSEKYTGYESTSITYEKANQLMEAVIYCIDEYLHGGPCNAGGCGVGGHSLLKEGMSAGNVMTAKEVTAKEAYRLGCQLAEAKVHAMKELYHALIRDFHSYGNIALKDTVNAVPEFLKWYDIRYAPQDTILTLDYPLLKEVGTGIDAVYEFVRCVSIEQRFLNKFPEAYVTQTLCSFSEEYEEMFENLCGILLGDVAGHILLKKQFDGDGIGEYERGRIRALLGMYSEEEAKALVRESVRRFIEEFYGNDGEMWQYLKGECDNIAVRLIHSL